MPGETSTRPGPTAEARARLVAPGARTPEQQAAGLSASRWDTAAHYAGVGAVMGTVAAHFSGGNKTNGALAGAAIAGLGMRLIAEPGMVAETGMTRGLKEMAVLAVLTGGLAAEISGGSVAKGVVAGTVAAVPAFFLMQYAKRLLGF